MRKSLLIDGKTAKRDKMIMCAKESQNDNNVCGFEEGLLIFTAQGISEEQARTQRNGRTCENLQAFCVNRKHDSNTYYS